MKLGICVVLYEHDFKSIKKIKEVSNRIVAVDNGLNNVHSSVNYISMNGNKGIAAALNTGLTYLKNQGCDVALTLDDDSLFPVEDKDSILKLIDEKIEEYGVLGLNFNVTTEIKTDEIEEVPYWLTSGNFVNLKAWESVNGYREELFVDYVDFDFCTRLRKADFKVGYLKDYSISHSIGNPLEFKIFGRTFHAMNHAPVRDYYRFRNARYLAHEDFKSFGRAYLRELFWELPKLLLIERNRKEKIKMIVHGIKDAKKGKLGKFE